MLHRADANAPLIRAKQTERYAAMTGFAAAKAMESARPALWMSASMVSAGVQETLCAKAAKPHTQGQL